MSMINAYGDPIIINWEIDDNGEKISIPILNETKQVVGNKLVLEGLPDEQYRVFIDGFIEINIKEKITETNQFKVDYRKNGVVFVHESLDGQWLTISKYSSRGVYFIPSSRIWTKVDDLGNVVSTLADMEGDLGEIASQFDTINTMAENASGIATSLETNVTLGTTLNTNLQTSIDTATTKKTQLDGSISTSTASKSNLDTSISNANTSKSNLDISVGKANTSKSNLDSSISSGNTLKTNLDGSISTGTTLKNDLDANITTGNQLKVDLPPLVSDAGTAKTNLDSSITEGNTLKGELDVIIAGTDFEQVIIDVDSLKINKADKDYVNTELDKKVDNSRVLKDVPVNADFTNTTYTAGAGLELTGTEFTPKFGTTAGTITQGNDSRLSDTRVPKAHSHVIGDLPPYPTSLPANGGNADTVGGFTVGVSVPANAKFTDTIPDTSSLMPISGGEFISYTEKLITTTGVIDLSLGNIFHRDATADTTFSITNAKSNTAHSFSLYITMGATVRTINFPSSVKWQNEVFPDMSKANKVYLATFSTINGGTQWLANWGAY